MAQRIVVLVSGGMDSATLLTQKHRMGHDVAALTLFYGQRHHREITCAEELCKYLGVPHTVCDLRVLKTLLKGSSQTDNIPVPEGHYADPVMRVTVVPNRNMILLACAAAFAISQGAVTVAYAAHAGDHAVYPDCRPEFVEALRAALKLCHYDGGVRLDAPYTDLTKADIVAAGHLLHVPYELTYSCYAGRPNHCGKCGTCVERRLAFREAGFPDPVEYECTVEETLATFQFKA